MDLDIQPFLGSIQAGKTRTKQRCKQHLTPQIPRNFPSQISIKIQPNPSSEMFQERELRK